LEQEEYSLAERQFLIVQEKMARKRSTQLELYKVAMDNISKEIAYYESIYKAIGWES